MSGSSGSVPEKSAACFGGRAVSSDFVSVWLLALASGSLLAELTKQKFLLPFLDSRKLGTAGQKLGGAAVLCHIKHDPVDPGGSFTLTSANVGKCQTVLCRNGKPLPLSRSYVMSCEEELKRIKQHKAIITEVRGGEFSSRWWGGQLGQWCEPMARMPWQVVCVIESFKGSPSWS